MKKIIMFCLPFLLLTCKHSTSTEATIEERFAIYLLADSTITAGTAMEQSIESLIIADKPFMTSSDLKSYFWSSHSFELTSEMNSRWENFQKHGGKVSGMPFVITASGERIYSGTFWWAYSSQMPPACAVIEILQLTSYKIELMNGAKDKRSDPRIYNALKKSGVLVE